MRILLTNDDGIHAGGFAVLEAIAQGLSDDIWVCAPSEEQSGAGHSLSLSRPVRLRHHGEKRFSVTGTPTDCVMIALREAMDHPPDLILSGVNRGANLGDDVTYSGTVSAAIEGTLAGIRSIALSQVYRREDVGGQSWFEAAQAWGKKVVVPLMDRGTPAVKTTRSPLLMMPVSTEASTACSNRTSVMRSSSEKPSSAPSR